MKGAARGVVKLGEWVCYYDVSNIVNLRALNGGIDECIVRHHFLVGKYVFLAVSWLWDDEPQLFEQGRVNL